MSYDYEKELEQLRREIESSDPGDLPPLPENLSQIQGGGSVFQAVDDAAQQASSVFDDPEVQRQARQQDPMSVLTEGAGLDPRNPRGVSITENQPFQGNETDTELLRELVSLTRDLPQQIAEALSDVFVLG